MVMILNIYLVFDKLIYVQTQTELRAKGKCIFGLSSRKVPPRGSKRKSKGKRSLTGSLLILQTVRNISKIWN